ncbi:MAG: FadR family transcriptional regulator [Spirochaetia bacterium]|nr:FadR family transcriptional regulator [Spirochaetia bacterium]
MSFNTIGKRETLPEKVSKIIKESILTGELKGGDALPTEPELEKEFGVSRAVIRDAMRMLKAQGLIDVKHGKGMYISYSQTEAFTDALITSLRRDNASAWDVEQFEQILLPQIFALAATEAADQEIVLIKMAASDYLAAYRKMLEQEQQNDDASIPLMQKLMDNSQIKFAELMRSIFSSTHNKLIMLLGDVLINLRKWRTISGDTEYIPHIEDFEKSIIARFVQAIETRNPIEAAALISKGINYDPSMVTIMKNTPVGESPEIPGSVFFSAYTLDNGKN